ncbi:MAG: hypothetical protein C6H99_01665 [Epsilonproteobacteria bacterium]|nr:hypothetical protein [Campylobacterota bacterium]NPA63942.1 PQQ-binding-like beta-propeller repeat protein [Campylobacterota bacterium]
MRIWIASLLVALVFVGCSSKKYFEPEEVAGVVSYDGKLPAKIIDVLRDGATLEDGHFISEDGLEEYRLPKDHLFIKKGGGYYIAASRCDRVVVIDQKSKERVYERRFDSKAPVAANIQGSLLALVFDNGSLALYDIDTDELLYSSDQKGSIAVDTKIANPYFLGELVIFPTLDGKLVVVDPKRGRELRTLIAGTKPNFNNVIFLDVIDERLIAATPNKIISVSPQLSSSLDLEISDVLYTKGRVYILTKDGRIILTDPALNILKSRKYSFAHFTGAIYGEYIYIIERGGYIIAVDKDLRVSNIFRFPDQIEEYIFCAKDKVYYGDNYFVLNRP